jgi:hypothetical protein
MTKTPAQQQMLAALDRAPIAYPVSEPPLGAAKLRTLKALRRRGLVKSRVWTEDDGPNGRLSTASEDWIQWSKA